jgi:hypothetical protein
MRLLENQLGLEPQHAIAQLMQSPIAPRVGAAPPRVIRPVGLHHEPDTDCGKISDETAS